jgi:hypothetical protein
MRALISAVMLAALTGLGVRAVADDTNTDRPVESHKQMMKECMAKARAADSAASIEDLKKTCREKIKSYDAHPSETTPPPANPG